MVVLTRDPEMVEQDGELAGYGDSSLPVPFLVGQLEPPLPQTASPLATCQEHVGSFEDAMLAVSLNPDIQAVVLFDGRSAAEWQAIEKKHNLDPKSMSELGFEGRHCPGDEVGGKSAAFQIVAKRSGSTCWCSCTLVHAASGMIESAVVSSRSAPWMSMTMSSPAR